MGSAWKATAAMVTTIGFALIFTSLFVNWYGGAVEVHENWFDNEWDDPAIDQGGIDLIRVGIPALTVATAFAAAALSLLWSTLDASRRWGWIGGPFTLGAAGIGTLGVIAFAIGINQVFVNGSWNVGLYLACAAAALLWLGGIFSLVATFTQGRPAKEAASKSAAPPKEKASRRSINFDDHDEPEPTSRESPKVRRRKAEPEYVEDERDDYEESAHPTSGSSRPRLLQCPRCDTVIKVAPGVRPVCGECGFTS